jgi:hypothetical protein
MKAKPQGEGAWCTCRTEAEHQEMLARIDGSYRRDGERLRESPSATDLIARARASANGLRH